MGKSRSEAQAQLDGLGLKLAVVSTAQLGCVADTVCTQDPPAGTKMQPGDTITVDILVAVPNLVGSSKADALSALSNAGLRAGTITEQSDDSTAKDCVISSNPPAGTLEPTGTAIDIVVSLGP